MAWTYVILFIVAIAWYKLARLVYRLIKDETDWLDKL